VGARPGAPPHGSTSLREALTQGLEKDAESYTSRLATLKRRYADVL